MPDPSSGADADADSNTTPCQYCGEGYAPRGVAAHERHCNENPENQSDATDTQTCALEESASSASLEPAERAPKSGATETPLEARALERDGCCRRCGARGAPVDTDTDIVDLDWDGDLDVDPDVELTVEPLIPGDTVESLADVVTLCTDCEELLDDGIHWLTRRSKILFEGPDTR